MEFPTPDALAKDILRDAQTMTLAVADEDGPWAAPVVFINPEIVKRRGMVEDEEGCLSFPDLYQDIRRFKTVKAQFYGLDGQLHEMVSSDLAARIWQHEIDHLHGTLFIDKMGPLARMSSRKDLDSFIAEFEEGVKKGVIPPGTEMKL